MIGPRFIFHKSSFARARDPNEARDIPAAHIRWAELNALAVSCDLAGKPVDFQAARAQDIVLKGVTAAQ